MLNQTQPHNLDPANQWCVGEPPLRWDISFGARLAEQIKRIFRREASDQPIQPTPRLPLKPVKKAA